MPLFSSSLLPSSFCCLSSSSCPSGLTICWQRFDNSIPVNATQLSLEALPGLLCYFYCIHRSTQASHATAIHPFRLSYSPYHISLALSLFPSLANLVPACWLSIKKPSLRVAQALWVPRFVASWLQLKKKIARAKKTKTKWENGKNVFPLSYFRVRIKWISCKCDCN